MTHSLVAASTAVVIKPLVSVHLQSPPAVGMKPMNNADLLLCRLFRLCCGALCKETGRAWYIYSKTCFWLHQQKNIQNSTCLSCSDSFRDFKLFGNALKNDIHVVYRTYYCFPTKIHFVRIRASRHVLCTGNVCDADAVM